MTTRRAQKSSPLRFDDGFRGGIAMGFPVVAVVVFLLLSTAGVIDVTDLGRVMAACAALTVAFTAYIVWTHLVFSAVSDAEATRIAAAQYRRGPSRTPRFFGFRSTESWAISAAVAALMGAVAAAVFGAEAGGAILTLLVLLTAVSAWATVVYAFALRYLRLHAAGEEFVFEVDGTPGFSDFLSLALMISAAGSLAPASPRTRAGLRAVRTHTVIGFAFNALVIAVTVSLISGLITTFGPGANG